MESGHSQAGICWLVLVKKSSTAQKQQHMLVFSTGSLNAQVEKPGVFISFSLPHAKLKCDFLIRL